MTKKCTFITSYNRDEKSIRDCSLVEFKEPSKVKESLSYAIDINTIYDNYCKTGKIPLNGAQPIYDENFVNYDSLQEATSIVNQATSYFASLPADIRSHYGNNLNDFVRAIHSNDEFLVNSGVLKKIVKDVAVEPSVPLAPSIQVEKPSLQPSKPSVQSETQILSEGSSTTA